MSKILTVTTLALFVIGLMVFAAPHQPGDWSVGVDSLEIIILISVVVVVIVAVLAVA